VPTDDVILLALFGLVLLGVLLLLLRQRPRRGRAAGPHRTGRPTGSRQPKNWILVDGSNVMHWKNETPQISTIRAVVKALMVRGFKPGVVFDANAGYKLNGRYMNERAFATLLNLPKSQILVVPKGTQADPYILGHARDFGARIVTRDRFRDWSEDYPEVTEPGFLIRGGYRDSGELWLDETQPAKAEAAA